MTGLVESLYEKDRVGDRAASVVEEALVAIARRRIDVYTESAGKGSKRMSHDDASSPSFLILEFLRKT